MIAMPHRSSLRLRRLREEYEVAEHALHREIRKQYPDLTIGPLYETDQGQSQDRLPRRDPDPRPERESPGHRRGDGRA